MAIILNKIDVNVDSKKIGVNMLFNGRRVRHNLDGAGIIEMIFRTAQEDYRETLNSQLSDLLSATDEKKEKAAK